MGNLKNDAVEVKLRGRVRRSAAVRCKETEIMTELTWYRVGSGV